MTRTTYKRVSFNLELAKKITKKETEGRIVTEDGLTARIVCFDLKYGGCKILAVLVDCGDYEIGVRCELDGTCRDVITENNFNLHIEVPHLYCNYSNFVPKKWQACIVRNFNYDVWVIRVCCGKDSDGDPTFFNSASYCYWNYILPLNNVTKHLVDTTKSYEQLIQELDAESTATAKKEQQ